MEDGHAPVSTGRRRLNIIVLVVAGMSVALILGTVGYLVYNRIKTNYSSIITEAPATVCHTTPAYQTSLLSSQHPTLISSSPVVSPPKRVSTLTVLTYLLSDIESTKSYPTSEMTTEHSSTQSALPNLPNTSSTSTRIIFTSARGSTESISSNMPVVTTEPTSPGITASCETDLTGTPLDCSEVGSCGGMFYVFPCGEEGSSVPVFCACEGEAEVWTVIQKRFDGSVDFNRTWTDYKNGFGDACGEYWLGNEALHQLTAMKSFKLMIILTSWDHHTKFGIYETFSVADEVNGYRLHLGQYYGNADDSMVGHNNCKFSTRDKDNDNNSTFNYAERYSGAWWYCDGLQSNLNGIYYRSPENPDMNGILWTNSYGTDSLRETMMMIQPAG